MDNKNLLVDFCAIAEFADGKIGQPCIGAKEALQELSDNGYDISIYIHGADSSDDAEKFLKDNNITYSKLVTLPSYDILVAKDAVHASCEWKWTLESIVMHSPYKPKDQDLKKQMHDAFTQYTKLAKKVVHMD